MQTIENQLNKFNKNIQIIKWDRIRPKTNKCPETQKTSRNNVT